MPYNGNFQCGKMQFWRFQKWNLKEVQYYKVGHIIVATTSISYVFSNEFIIQKQPPKGVTRESYSENMQQIYRRTPMPKCDFNKVALQLYWNHTLAWVLSCKICCMFLRTPFLKNTSGWLLLIIE